jgi:hypothetical protein
MKHEVTRFADLVVALKELEPFVRNVMALETGRPSKQLGNMLPREAWANWLLCVAINSMTGSNLTFTSDPTGGDGIICDDATGETWSTEHVMIPRLESGDAQALILKRIEEKQEDGAPYAGGKTLIVFLDAEAGMWSPPRSRSICPSLYISRPSGLSVCRASRRASTSTP